MEEGKVYLKDIDIWTMFKESDTMYTTNGIIQSSAEEIDNDSTFEITPNRLNITKTIQHYERSLTNLNKYKYGFITSREDYHSLFKVHWKTLCKLSEEEGSIGETNEVWRKVREYRDIELKKLQ